MTATQIGAVARRTQDGVTVLDGTAVLWRDPAVAGAASSSTRTIHRIGAGPSGTTYLRKRSQK
jgi:hypothetical protein